MKITSNSSNKAPGAFNKWREQNPDIVLDLTGAPLNRVELPGAQLAPADLEGANLTGAILTRARLPEANLMSANLRESDLVLANLVGANLADSNPRGRPTWSRPSWVAADLNTANLRGSLFEDATIGYTVFADVDLLWASGLDSVSHVGPSTIGVDTIFRSQGTIPDSFLRGCGVPEELITHLPRHHPVHVAESVLFLFHQLQQLQR